jgi:hypothetical protein
MLRDHNIWIGVCFAVYVAVIFVFAIIYYALHRQAPSRFFFVAGVEDAQRSIYEKNIRNYLEALAAETEALPIIEELVSKSGGPWAFARRGAEGTLPSGRGFLVDVLKRPSGSSTDDNFPYIELRNANGRLVARVPFPLPWFWQPWEEAFLKRHHQNQARTALLERRLRSIATNPYDVWSFWDFLYFSAICQSTVGFGDILPNATPVRLLVVTQIILGYGILVVLLNVVFHP